VHHRGLLPEDNFVDSLVVPPNPLIDYPPTSQLPKENFDLMPVPCSQPHASQLEHTAAAEKSGWAKKPAGMKIKVLKRDFS
jgi:hypothetical protein